MSLKNPVKPPGIDPGTAQVLARRLNYYATPGPKDTVSSPLTLRQLHRFYLQSKDATMQAEA